jgi:peptide/nickel transport system substrate-binding protein
VTLVQSDLRKVGVDVRIDLRPFAVFFGENARHRTLPHLAFYAWTLDPTSTGCALFCSDRIPSEANHFRGQNFPGLRDDDVTAWLSAADASLDNGVRKSLVAQAQARIATLVPVVPLYFRPVLVASSARVTGLAPSGTLTPVTAGAVLWDVAR